MPRSVWRWSRWSCRVVRSDGRLLHKSLRSGEPHKRVSCGPYVHRGEECHSSSVVPCPPQYSEDSRKPSDSWKRLSMMA
jgi:hypothetical protein